MKNPRVNILNNSFLSNFMNKVFSDMIREILNIFNNLKNISVDKKFVKDITFNSDGRVLSYNVINGKKVMNLYEVSNKINKKLEDKEVYVNLYNWFVNNIPNLPQDDLSKKCYVKTLIKRFIIISTRKFFEERDSEEISEYLENIFNKELNNEELEFVAKILFKGIVVKEPLSINLSNGTEIKIRRVNENDLTEWINSPGYNKYMHPDSHMTLKIKKDSFYEAQEEIHRIKNLLRLFDLGNIFYLCYYFETTTLTNGTGGVFSLNNHPNEIPFYFLEKKDIKKLKNFLDNMLPLTNEKLSLHSTKNYLDIALKRYKDALTDNSPSIRRLTLFIMGLEALYLQSNSELKFRLSIKAALLLSNFSENPNDVFTNIKKAYDLRSKYVHGKMCKNQELNNLLLIIGNYLRKSIIIFLVSDKKENFLHEIKTSLYDKNSSDKLTKKITNKLKKLYED